MVICLPKKNNKKIKRNLRILQSGRWDEGGKQQYTPQNTRMFSQYEVSELRERHKYFLFPYCLPF